MASVGNKVRVFGGFNDHYHGTIVDRFVGDDDDEAVLYDIRALDGFLWELIPQIRFTVIASFPGPPPPLPVPIPEPVPDPIPEDDDGGLGGFVGAVTDFIKELLDDGIREITDLIDNTVDLIVGPINNVVKDVSDTVSSVFNTVTDFALEGVGLTVSALDSVTEFVSAGLDGALDAISKGVDAVSGVVINAVDASIEGLSTVLSDVIFIGNTVLGSAIDEVESIVSTISQEVSEFVEGAIGTLESVLSAPLDILANSIPLSLSDIGASLAGVGQGFEDLLSLGGDLVQDALTSVLEKLGVDKLLGLFNLMGNVIAQVDAELGDVSDLTARSGSWDHQISRADVANIYITNIPIVGGLLRTAQAGEFVRINNSAMAHSRPTLMSEGVALEFLRRFPGQENMAIDGLRAIGYSEAIIHQLTEINTVPMAPLDAVASWKRGFINEGTLDEMLRDAGVSGFSIGLIKQLSNAIPPIQDQILFSVRGVFDVAESEAFGEFEGLPADIKQEFVDAFDIGGGSFEDQVRVFADEAAKIGLPKAWVAAYWTSHWRLPSLQTAYEMFHRLAPDIVDAEADDFIANGFNPADIKFDTKELDRLVRSSDYAGFWRGKLQAIAYNPLTRVDIRRIHKLLDKDTDWLIRQYRKVGFSPSDAGLMAQFTVAFNEAPENEDATELQKLSRTQVLDFVENGIISEADGVAQLMELGYHEFAAEAFVSLELAKVERKLQKVEIDLLTEQVLGAIVTIEEAKIELDGLEIATAQRDVVVREWELRTAKKARNPSKGDLNALLKEGVIGEDEFKQGLSALGFSEMWQDRFFALKGESQGDE